jgi:adenosylhomocysteinase
VLFAGKNFVVCGYGWCGRGVANRARGMGANVIVTEVNHVRALEAVMDGFRVMPAKEAAKIGDIFLTASGSKDVLSGEHFRLMKDGAILANTGHFNVEVAAAELAKMAVAKREIRPNNVEYTLPGNKRLYLLAEGRLVNLAAAEGHPSEVMDLSFANQALSVEFLAKKGGSLKPGLHCIPQEQDREIAKLKLEALGVSIDSLTGEQKRYSSNWKEGT